MGVIKRISSKIRRTLSNERGWTLLEKAVAIIIVILVLGATGPRLYHSGVEKNKQFISDVDGATITIEDNGAPTSGSTTMGD